MITIKRLSHWRLAAFVSAFVSAFVPAFVTLLLAALFLVVAYNPDSNEYAILTHPKGGIVAFLWAASFVIFTGLITYTMVCFFYYLYKSIPLLFLPLGLILKGKSYIYRFKAVNFSGLCIASALLVGGYFVFLNYASMMFAINLFSLFE